MTPLTWIAAFLLIPACAYIPSAPFDEEPVSGKADTAQAMSYLNCWDQSFFYNAVEIHDDGSDVDVLMTGGLLGLPGFSNEPTWNSRTYSWSFPHSDCTWSATDSQLVSCYGTVDVSASKGAEEQSPPDPVEMTLRMTTSALVRELPSGEVMSAIELAVEPFGLGPQTRIEFVSTPVQEACSSDSEKPAFVFPPSL